MKRNLKNSCFIVLGFLLVCNLLSCNNIFIFKKTTQVSFNLNIQGLQVAHQKQSGALNNRAAGGDVSQVIISLYQATDPASISENQQLDTSKLKHLESITPAVAPDGKVIATFNEVTVGISAVIFVEIYETDPADASQNLAYKGNSSAFTVQEGENNVEIELKKIISTLAKLQTVLQSTNGEPIYIAGNFEINSTLKIDKPTMLIADAQTTFTRATELTGALFTNSADFTIQGSENAIITINGNNIEASAPAIQSTANLTVTYCNFENNTNKATDGGAIFVDTTATVTFSASNCNFTDNQVTGSSMAGGAVAINAANSTSSFDTCKFSSNIAKQQGGGAIYISGNNATSQNALWHTFNNCTFNGNQTYYNGYNYGGAIYLQKGAIHLNSVTMQENKYNQSGTSTQPDNSDIFLGQSATVLKLNGTIKINTLILEIPSNNLKNLGISDTFNTANSSIDKITLKPVSGSITDGFQMFNIFSYDSIGTSAASTKQLISQQINCFKSITNVDGTASYTLNSDGTISTQ